MVPQLAINSSLMSCGIYEKMSKVTIGGKRQWKKNKRVIDEVLDEDGEFIDPEFPPDENRLAELSKQNSKLVKYMSWFRIHKFFNKEKYSLVNQCIIKNQVIANRGYVYLIDALNVLSIQPGLVFRLFERKKTPREGIYSVWINKNGKWINVLLDDYLPIFGDKNEKTKFFFTTPNPKMKEIWYLLVEKAMAKCYGGYRRLFNGFENYAIRDMTGAPHLMHDIPHIPLGKKIKQRELDHINTTWEKLYKNLRKGYLISAVPRLPTQMEKLKNKDQKIPNKMHYLNNGIYSGHNVGIVTIREVYDSNNNLARIIKIRNPWIGEIWQGNWSKDSKLWTNELKHNLRYDPETDGDGEFWMSIKDFMSYYECLNVYKCIPGHTYNSIQINVPNDEFARLVVRISVPAKGKYTFSIDQNDLRVWDNSSLKYSPINLTLGQVEHDTFKLLSHTSSQKLRNTFIRKLIERGEYYLLIEKRNVAQKKKLVAENPSVYSTLNNVSVSSYGPRTCGMTTITDPRKNKVVYDYLCYFGWKGYSEQRIGQEINKFKVNFYDGSWNFLSLYLLNIPESIIYAFKNDNNFGVELNSKFAGITNKEIIGPEGKISFEQEFSMNGGCSDVFILRDIDNPVPGIKGLVNNKFQIKSVVGRKYIGEKDNPVSFNQIKDYLLTEKASRKTCEIEKDRSVAKKVGVFDLLNNFEKIEMKKTEIKVKVKHYTSPMKLDQYEDIIDMNQVKKFQPMIDESAAAKAKIKAQNKEAQEKIRKIKEEKETRREIDRTRSMSHHIKGMSEADKQALRDANRGISQDVKKVTQTLKDIKPASPMTRMKEEEPPVITEEQKKKNLQILAAQIKTVDGYDDARLAKVLTLQKHELLNIENQDLKQLLRYFGIQAFITIYQVDDFLLQKIVQKLLGVINNSNNQQGKSGNAAHNAQSPQGQQQENLRNSQLLKSPQQQQSQQGGELSRRIVQNSSLRGDAISAHSRAQSQRQISHGRDKSMDLLKPEAALKYAKGSKKQQELHLQQIRQQELEEQMKLQAELQRQLEEQKMLQQKQQQIHQQNMMQKEQEEQALLLKRKQELIKMQEEQKLKEQLERERIEQEKLQNQLNQELHKSQELAEQIAAANINIQHNQQENKENHLQAGQQQQGLASTILSKSQEYQGNLNNNNLHNTNSKNNGTVAGQFSTPSKNDLKSSQYNQSQPPDPSDFIDFNATHNSISSKISGAPQQQQNQRYHQQAQPPQPRPQSQRQKIHPKVAQFSTSPQPTLQMRSGNLKNLENKIQDKLKAMKSLHETYSKKTSALANSRLSPRQFSKTHQPESYVTQKLSKKITEGANNIGQVQRAETKANAFQNEQGAVAISSPTINKYISQDIEVERESEHHKFLRGSKFSKYTTRKSFNKPIGSSNTNMSKLHHLYNNMREGNAQGEATGGVKAQLQNKGIFKDKLARGSIPDSSFQARMIKKKMDMKRHSFNVNPSTRFNQTGNFSDTKEQQRLSKNQSQDLNVVAQLRAHQEGADLQNRLRKKLDEAKRNKNLTSTSKRELEMTLRPGSISGGYNKSNIHQIGQLERQTTDNTQNARSNLEQYLTHQPQTNSGNKNPMKQSNYLRISNAEIGRTHGSTINPRELKYESNLRKPGGNTIVRGAGGMANSGKKRHNYQNSFNQQNYIEKRKRRRNGNAANYNSLHGNAGGSRTKADRILNKLQNNLRESQMQALQKNYATNPGPASRPQTNQNNYSTLNQEYNKNLQMFEEIEKATLNNMNRQPQGPPYKNKRARKTTNPEFFRRNQRGLDYHRPPPPAEAPFPTIVDSNHNIQQNYERRGSLTGEGARIDSLTQSNMSIFENNNNLNHGAQIQMSNNRKHPTGLNNKRKKKNMARGMSHQVHHNGLTQTHRQDQRKLSRGQNGLGSIDHIRSMKKIHEKASSRNMMSNRNLNNNLQNSPPPPAPAPHMSNARVKAIPTMNQNFRNRGGMNNPPGQTPPPPRHMNHLGSPHTPAPNSRKPGLLNNLTSNRRNRMNNGNNNNNNKNSNRNDMVNRQGSPAPYGYNTQEPMSTMTPRGNFLQLNNNLIAREQERNTMMPHVNNNIGDNNNNIPRAMYPGNQDPNYGRAASIDNRNRYTSNFNPNENRHGGFGSPDPRINNNYQNEHTNPRQRKNPMLHLQHHESENLAASPQHGPSPVRGPGPGPAPQIRSPHLRRHKKRNNMGGNNGHREQQLMNSPPPPAPAPPGQTNRLSMTNSLRDEFNNRRMDGEKKLAYGNNRKKKKKPKNKSFLSGLFG